MQTKRRWTAEKIQLARDLRSTGHTLGEIQKALCAQFGNASYGRIWDYIKNTPIKPDYQLQFKRRQRSSTYACEKGWEDAEQQVYAILGSAPLTQRELLLTATMLYWAEGSKGDLCISNGDPLLLKSFKYAFQELLGVSNDRFNFSLLLYEDLDREQCIEFWSTTLGLSHTQFKKIWLRKGKERGKLQYGIGILRLKEPKNELKLLLKSGHLIAKIMPILAPVAQPDRAPTS